LQGDEIRVWREGLDHVRFLLFRVSVQNKTFWGAKTQKLKIQGFEFESERKYLCLCLVSQWVYRNYADSPWL
jgi:hypothetical protein